MIFSSNLFTFLFLPIVLGLYYLSKSTNVRNYILLAASLVFYACGEPVFVYVMIALIVLNYFLALAIDRSIRTGNRVRAKVFLILDIVIDLGVLFVFKYLCFTIEAVNTVFGSRISAPQIVLPIGISFFTFQAMSYVVDVYRKDAEVQKNPLYLALYISFFPQLIAGPIVRYKQIADEITHRRVISFSQFGRGCERFMTGFCKKVLLANNLALIAEETFSYLDFAAAGHSPFYYWIGILAYAMQLFYDFSGYSDMAIGLGLMFGFHFEENFNYPYMCASITDYWKRWHISLSRWFRDYVYIPLGGSRRGVPRHIFNMFIVWMLTGLWHGADYQYIAWGLFSLFFLLLEKYIVKPEKMNTVAAGFWRVLTLCAILISLVLFRCVGIKQGIAYIFAMFGGYLRYAPGTDEAVIRIGRDYMPYLVLGILFCTPAAQCLQKRLEQRPGMAVLNILVFSVGRFLAFLWAVSFLVMGAHNPFIYFNF